MTARWVAAALGWLGRVPRSGILGTGILLVLLITLISHESRLEIRFSFLYLVPIALVSWFVGRSAGIAVSLASAAAWLFVARLQPARFSNDIFAYWNGGLLFSVFLLLAILLSSLRRALDRDDEPSRREAHLAFRQIMADPRGWKGRDGPEEP